MSNLGGTRRSYYIGLPIDDDFVNPPSTHRGSVRRGQRHNSDNPPLVDAPEGSAR